MKTDYYLVLISEYKSDRKILKTQEMLNINLQTLEVFSGSRLFFFHLLERKTGQFTIHLTRQYLTNAYFTNSHISSVNRVFSIQNNPKNLDLSYKKIYIFGIVQEGSNLYYSKIS